MNREIKFRVWDKRGKRFVNEFEVKKNGFIKVFYLTPVDCENDQHIFTLQQFTGLTDKNGKEIYEGDILDIQTEDHPDDLQWELASVEFKKGCFWINGVFEQPINELIVGDCVDGKIVGNIFENPELHE